MPSTSKSSQRKPKKLKFIPKPKQRWQVKQPARNWLELPSDVMANILHRIGVIDILQNAQKVCTAWRQICKDPAMWRVLTFPDPHEIPPVPDILNVPAMCKHAVDRSQGQLTDVTIVNFDDELLLYVADRSSRLKRLKVACCYDDMCGSWSEALKKFPLLEELSLYETKISKEAIETVGRYCPLLKTLKLNQKAGRFWDEDTDKDSMAMAIGENLHELEHLELIGNSMSNTGLQVILDGCRHLKTLDLRWCCYIDLKGDIGKRCSEQIKYLNLPTDSLEGCPYIYGNDSETCDLTIVPRLPSDDEYHDYDDFTVYDDDIYDFEDLNEMLTFMAMVG